MQVFHILACAVPSYTSKPRMRGQTADCPTIRRKPMPRYAVQKVREVGTSNRLRQVASRFALQSRRSQRCGFWSTRQNAKQVPTSRTFCTASSSCGQAIRGRMPASSPGRAFLPMYLLRIPAQTRCKGASGGDATNSPALARCINLRGRAMLAPTCTCKAAYRAAASPIRRSQQKKPLDEELRD